MNKVVWGCCLLGLMASCAGEKKKTVPLEELTEQMDSVQPTVTDTVPAVEEWVKEEPVPVTADESFADFFYNFASDEPFQRARIVFPISYYKGEEVVRTTLGEAVTRYTENPPKGEFVLVLAGAAPAAEPECTLEEAVLQAQALMDQGLSRKDAARQAAQATGFPKKAIYDATLSD